MSEQRELPSGWCWAKVEDLAVDGEAGVLTGPFGTSLSRTDFVASGVPVLTIGCLTETGVDVSRSVYVSPTKAHELSRYTLREGDLLFSRMATVGRAGFVTAALDGALFNYHIMRLRLTPSLILPEIFLAYVRGSFEVSAYLESINHGATRDGINTSQLLSLPVRLPPLAEQKRIVAKLDDLLARSRATREALTAVVPMLDRYRQSVLAAAFEGARSDASGVMRTTLEDITSIITSGSRGWGQHYSTVDTGSRFIRIGEISHESVQVDVANAAWVKAPGDAEAARSRVIPGDILVSITADVGMVGVVPDGVGDAYINQHIALCRIRDRGAVSPLFVAHMLRDPAGLRRVIRGASYGATKASLSLGQLRSLPIPLPPLPEQQEIVRRVDAAFARIAAVRALVDAQLARLDALDRSILARAFRGELVPQDPSDEPASALLERLRAERAAAPAKKARRARASA